MIIIAIVASGPTLVGVLGLILYWSKELKSIICNACHKSAVFVSYTWHMFKRWGYIKTYFSFGRASQIVLLVMFLLGVVVLAFIWTTDQGINVKIGGFDVKRPTWLRPYNEQWLHSRTYIPSVLAGLTGFLIGAPVAAVFLASFTVEREEKAALARVNGLSKLAWDQYRQSVYSFCSDDRIAALEDAQTVQYAYNRLRREHIYYRREEAERKKKENTTNPILELYQKFVRTAREKIPEWQEALDRISQWIPPDTTLTLEWHEILTNWATLDQYVRLQRLDQRLLWFDRDVNSELRQRMSWQTQLLRDFSTAHEKERGSAMVAALESLRELIELAVIPFNLREYDEHDEPAFFTGDERSYLDAANKVLIPLRELRALIERVDAAGWPESASKPVV
jgi:hypothetical protein